MKEEHYEHIVDHFHLTPSNISVFYPEHLDIGNIMIGRDTKSRGFRIYSNEAYLTFLGGGRVDPIIFFHRIKTRELATEIMEYIKITECLFV